MFVDDMRQGFRAGLKPHDEFRRSRTSRRQKGKTSFRECGVHLSQGTIKPCAIYRRRFLNENQALLLPPSRAKSLETCPRAFEILMQGGKLQDLHFAP